MRLQLLCAVLISFAVGLGGQYYNHHYIFALPCYILCVILLLESIYSIFLTTTTLQAETAQETAEQENPLLRTFVKLGKACLGVLTVLSLTGIYLLPKPDYAHYDKILAYSVSMKKDAKYLDEVLDALDEATYQYFGFNGPIVYAYTEHDPLGPVFFQDPNNLTDESSFFAENLVAQMDETNVYVVSYIRCGVLNDYVNSYIAENFTLLQQSEQAALVSHIEKPATFTYKIYVRKGL